MFDDGFNHSVWHRGPPESGPRTMLMVRLWHPEVTVELRRVFSEIGFIEGVYDTTSSDDLAQQQAWLDYYDTQQAEDDFMAVLKEAAPMLQQFTTTITTDLRLKLKRDKKKKK